jgi:phosphoribosylformimino-5-aminoimidazole carboxamide ribonucleotide (ProFAR) isomerase
MFIVTDISKDGTLQGPNFELLEKVCKFSNVPVIASGGVSSLADLKRLISMQDIGIQGAIVGKALYEGAFTVEEALAVVKP